MVFSPHTTAYLDDDGELMNQLMPIQSSFQTSWFKVVRPFSLISDVSRVETVLLQTQRFLNWQFSEYTSSGKRMHNARRSMHACKLLNKYCKGLHLLKENRHDEA